MAKSPSLPSPKDAARVLTTADLRAAGLQPMAQEPRVTARQNGVFVMYSLEGGTDGGIELDMFDHGDYAQRNFEINGDSGTTIAVPGADHAQIEMPEFDAQPYRMLTVWRGQQGFNLWLPNNPRVTDQLVSLGALVIQRLYK